MLNKLYPDTYLDSVDDIDFEMYYKKGIRGIERWETSDGRAVWRERGSAIIYQTL